MEVVRGEQFYKVDENGFKLTNETIIVEFIGDTLLTEVTDNEYIQVVIPQGLYRPKWNGSVWVEDMTPEEIDEFRKPQPKKKVSFEDLQIEYNVDLDYRLSLIEMGLI